MLRRLGKMNTSTENKHTLIRTTPRSLFTPVRSRNTFEETVERIAGAIKARLLSPGDQLPPERELARQLGVSRATLREALRVLVKAGYLEVRPGRSGGTFVARWPDPPQAPERTAIIQQMKDRLPALLDYRRAVEPAATELAAVRATEEDIAELESLLESMIGKEDAFEIYRSWDARFHVGIAQAAQSPLILQAVIEVQTALTEVLDLIVYHSERVLQHSTEYHLQILDAIRHHKPERARRLMRDHICATENIIRSLVPEADWLLNEVPSS